MAYNEAVRSYGNDFFICFMLNAIYKYRMIVVMIMMSITTTIYMMMTTTMMMMPMMMMMMVITMLITTTIYMMMTTTMMMMPMMMMMMMMLITMKRRSSFSFCSRHVVPRTDSYTHDNLDTAQHKKQVSHITNTCTIQPLDEKGTENAL